jgi:predicted PurR-regulated permease PerM
MNQEQQDIKILSDQLNGKVPWAVFIAVITIFLVVMGWLISLADSSNTKAQEAISRVSNLEGDIKEIKANVSWMRELIQKTPNKGALIESMQLAVPTKIIE